LDESIFTFSASISDQTVLSSSLLRSHGRRRFRNAINPAGLGGANLPGLVFPETASLGQNGAVLQQSAMKEYPRNGNDTDECHEAAAVLNPRLYPSLVFETSGRILTRVTTLESSYVFDGVRDSSSTKAHGG
jgi:hypothetical protein